MGSFFQASCSYANLMLLSSQEGRFGKFKSVKPLFCLASFKFQSFSTKESKTRSFLADQCGGPQLHAVNLQPTTKLLNEFHCFHKTIANHLH